MSFLDPLAEYAWNTIAYCFLLKKIVCNIWGKAFDNCTSANLKMLLQSIFCCLLGDLLKAQAGELSLGMVWCPV